MPFRPNIHDVLDINGKLYSVAPHPAGAGMNLPYAQEGRAALVYQLVADGEFAALKVLKPAYRVPSLAALTNILPTFSNLLGLKVCQRTILTARRNAPLLQQCPDLIYSILMPWIDGPTWVEVLLTNRELTQEQSLLLARAFAEVLVGMEERGVAHGDLSGSNVLLPALADTSWMPASQPQNPSENCAIELVDLEQFYGPGLEKPQGPLGGSSGYAHYDAPTGVWSAEGDRFAGAVLLAEMLGWCDPRVRNAKYGETYFGPEDLPSTEQANSSRYDVLRSVLEEKWGGNISALFEQAWNSASLADCPTFGEWLVQLPEHLPALLAHKKPANPTITSAIRHEHPSALNSADSTSDQATLRALLATASQLEEQGNKAEALQSYRHALAMIPSGTPGALEITIIVNNLEAQITPQISSGPSTVQEPKIGSPTGPYEELAIDDLFSGALIACERTEWARARELLSAVLNQQPQYTQHGKRADTLLTEVNKHISNPMPSNKAKAAVSLSSTDLSKKRRPPLAIALLGLIILVIVAEVAVLAFQTSADNSQRAQAASTVAVWSTATTVAAQATAMAKDMAYAYGVETAAAVATATAYAQGTQAAKDMAYAYGVETAAAVATATAHAQSTQTAMVLANQMSVAANKTATAVASVDCSAVNPGFLVLVCNNFNDNLASEWPTDDYMLGDNDAGSSQRSVRDGNYVITSEGTPFRSALGAPDLRMSDGNIVGNVSLDGTGTAGVSARWNYTGNYYCWIDKAQHFGCSKVLYDRNIPMIATLVDSNIRPDRYNSVELGVSGSKFQFWVNGISVATFEDDEPTLTTGSWGALVSTGSTGDPMTGYYNDLTIFEDIR